MSEGLRTVTIGRPKPRIIGWRRNGAPIYEIRGASVDTIEPSTGATGDVTQLNHRQTVNRMKDIRDDMDRIRTRAQTSGMSIDDEHTWLSLVQEFDKLDTHRTKMEHDAELTRMDNALNRGHVEPGSSPAGPGETVLRAYQDTDQDPILNPDSVERGRFRNPWDLSNMRMSMSRDAMNHELSQRAKCAIERMPFAPDKVRAAATSILETFEDKDATIARMVLATSSPEYLRGWGKLARGRGYMLDSAERDAVDRAMSLTDASGGYLVPFQLDPTVIITSAGSRNQIRQVARQVVATGDIWNGVSAGAVTWRWAAEASESGDNAPTMGQPTIQIHKADGFVPISIEALQDEANVAAEVARLLTFGRDVLEAAGFIVGTGTGQPWGIVSALTGTGAEVASTTADVFAAADIYKVDGALPARFRFNANWLGHRSIYNLVRQFDTQGGSQMWERIGGGMPAELLGQPALEAEDMDSTVAAGTNYLLVYGDFENYVIADRIGMQVEFIPHLVGANRRPTGQRGWYAYYRVGADSVSDLAFRMLNV